MTEDFIKQDAETIKMRFSHNRIISPSDDQFFKQLEYQGLEEDQISLSNLPVDFPTTLKNKHVEKIKKEDMMSMSSLSSLSSALSIKSN